MTRILLTIVIPLLAPTLAYIAYLFVARALQRRARGPGQGAQPLPALRTWPWLWLALAGTVLVALSFVFLSETTTQAPGGVYVPPQFIDGQVVPGHVVREGEAGAE